MLDYKVKFEVFEGPMDLLLYLVKKEEVEGPEGLCGLSICAEEIVVRTVIIMALAAM